MSNSRLKRAHRTHALDQPAGAPYPHVAAGQVTGQSGDAKLWASFAELCSRVSDPVKRAELLGVTPALDAAWQRGTLAPVLRAHRKGLERALHSTGRSPRHSLS